MSRQTGTYRVISTADEQVRAFVPHPLPPADPPLILDAELSALHSRALAALSQLAIAGALVPSQDWFLYAFVRKEAVITSEIEGTQATLRDVLTFEATSLAERPDDVREVCNYVDAVNYCRREIRRPRGLPLSGRLLAQAHARLMRGARGADKAPGEIRRSQNWVGGSRPGNARFVPPPPELVPGAMADLDRWIHSPSELSPLIRAGLAHVQFETIHPFLDGNGRIGRLLIALLIEHWGLLDGPLLYLSAAFRLRQQEYYSLLSAVRTDGDWEGWTRFFLECVEDSAQSGVALAKRLFDLIGHDRRKLLAAKQVTVPAIRLFDALPTHPFLTLARATRLLKSTKPTTSKAIDALLAVGVLRETTGQRRDRIFAYGRYLDLLADQTPPNGVRRP